MARTSRWRSNNRHGRVLWWLHGSRYGSLWIEIAATVEQVGISNFVTFLEYLLRRDLRRVEYGDERIPTLRQFLTDFPSDPCQQMITPVLITQGANDPRFRSETSRLSCFERANVPVWYVLAENEEHDFAKSKQGL